MIRILLPASDPRSLVKAVSLQVIKEQVLNHRLRLSPSLTRSAAVSEFVLGMMQGRADKSFPSKKHLV